MTRLHLVRHGRAAAGWDDDVDPGLDDVGRRQALAMATRLAPAGPLPVVTSPKRRCRETASLLAGPWGVEVIPEDAVGEIPSPPGVPLGQRIPWLREAIRGRWADLGPRYTEYRDAVVGYLTGLAADAVVVSHFVAINAAIGAATADDRLVVRHLDNCSVTVVDVVSGHLSLVEAGHEADTLIR